MQSAASAAVPSNDQKLTPAQQELRGSMHNALDRVAFYLLVKHKDGYLDECINSNAVENYVLAINACLKAQIKIEYDELDVLRLGVDFIRTSSRISKEKLAEYDALIQQLRNPEYDALLQKSRDTEDALMQQIIAAQQLKDQKIQQSTAGILAAICPESTVDELSQLISSFGDESVADLLPLQAAQPVETLSAPQAEADKTQGINPSFS
jgi:hypothetical protein